ncbi:P-loop containing nucleoside triphosphate hydrolase protein [Hypoxylon sp. NC1633]|nr:P-loop containing nucleoside triphosphate hydrolase protein [Hypoxylon sp. NC1633]
MKVINMGGNSGSSKQQNNAGNHSILTKVDKLREFIGTKVALPQLVVVGDQSSGKSSVLEGLTGFGFPRDAELCTRYATQITCRRETEESIHVSIIPHADAPSSEQERVKKFHRTLKEMSPESLAQLFKEANEAMGIRNSTKSTSSDGSSLPAFSEHILKVEKLGPDEEHFTVIDVPGIFRKETEGVTTEDDIHLVRKMVENYMKDTRTIILAIMPCNVDPATQEILKLAKKADPTMVRTMAVLTKPDLAIESTMQRIAIDHVIGTRSDLLLGYYIVKNRGPDDGNKTLEQGQKDELTFFSTGPWAVLKNTGKAGIDGLRTRVRELLIDLIKKEFPKLKTEVQKELQSLRSQLDKMGPSRSNEHTQRAYLNRLSEAFQSVARDALNAYYTGNEIFDDRKDLRLVTRVVLASEKYSEDIEKHGHTRTFASSDDEIFFTAAKPTDISELLFDTELLRFIPELEEVIDSSDLIAPQSSGSEDIMEYIAEVYRESRGQELGTFSPALVSTMFKEQSKKWKPITLSYVSEVILAVHEFIVEVLDDVCPDSRVRDELWNECLLEQLQGSYRAAMSHAKFLLEIEREGVPITLNHYFNDNLQKTQGGRLVAALREIGLTTSLTNAKNREEGFEPPEKGIFLSHAQLNNLSFNMGNSDHVREYMHDILKSYYQVSRKRFVDVVCQQAVNHYLLQGKESPLKIFSTQMVLNLSDDLLDMIAAEDAPVKLRREKLARDIKSFEEALKVLKGSG